ncbi:acetolactate synthase small subunit [Candidatus Methanomassiliicoccus intestinalis]|nr:MAG: acetolactate synthase small subunit [Candidatus Methanomassiliicoccus intestinalis]TQS81900.1 MAG: acetolactate synthase small subunit [Candidatus Methanomassiliicoccus intestinalis]
MKKRWISIFVENEVGVLARISGLFSGKSYNLNSLTVGTTEDQSISRMTISLTSDEQTFEQVKKQLNRSIEVIKVVDFTDIAIHMKELMFTKVFDCTQQDMTEIFRICKVFDVKAIDYNSTTVLLESIQTETRNDDLIRLLSNSFPNRLEIVRGGSVAIEAISITDR